MSNRLERGCVLPRRSNDVAVLLQAGIAGALLIALAACSGTTSSGAAPGGKGGKKGGGGDVPVTVAVAASKDVPVEVQVIGHVEAYSTISVKAQVTGQLNTAQFHEGDYVKKGDLLFNIDPRPLQAALNQAIANAAHDQAALGQSQANMARDAAQAQYADASANRYAQLFQEKVVSRDQTEQFRTTAAAANQAVEADKAAIESAKAAIGASQAAVDNARVQLSYTDIKSPIDGRLGSFSVKPGNVVMANSVELCTINQIEPIYVTFGVPEAQLPSIKEYMAAGKLPVRAQPQDDSNARAENGILTFVDNSVDVTTGTITLKGTFANEDRQLWPGQYVRVTLRLTTQHNATTVPNEAVMTGQNGSYVYVVKQDRSVDTRNVVPGARVGQDMVITSGVEPGDTVVTEGQLRLAPGSKVVVRQGAAGGGGRRAGADQTPAAAPEAEAAVPAAGDGEAAAPAKGDHKGRGGHGRGGKEGRKGPSQN
ncbi:MAG TPA: efflux RND transporter periplasmic adaptor subunit [Bryobacteraceae bacterium]|jgi:multidrug efflux system membrane fusion protein|nr:efflux RND transporter periplasmic adaptor subunit [Bryobacteraceae bacterium]